PCSDARFCTKVWNAGPNDSFPRRVTIRAPGPHARPATVMGRSEYRTRMPAFSRAERRGASPASCHAAIQAYGVFWAAARSVDEPAEAFAEATAGVHVPSDTSASTVHASRSYA